MPRPRSPYGVTELAGEHLRGLYHANPGLDTVSLRFFTVYGPRQRPDMAFHKFIKAMLEGREMVIYGDAALIAVEGGRAAAIEALEVVLD